MSTEFPNPFQGRTPRRDRLRAEISGGRERRTRGDRAGLEVDEVARGTRCLLGEIEAAGDEDPPIEQLRCCRRVATDREPGERGDGGSIERGAWLGRIGISAPIGGNLRRGTSEGR